MLSRNDQRYVVYNINTWKILNSKLYDSARTAKAARTKAINSGEIQEDQWKVELHSTYVRSEPMVETYNCLDPDRRKVTIPASWKGTHFDPAMESYWSM